MAVLYRAACIYLVIFLVGVFAADPDYQYAFKYRSEDIFSNTNVAEAFMADAFKWEARFHTDGVGVSIGAGTTYDGHGIDSLTGLPIEGGLHTFSAASKEALHLALLAFALRNDPYALSFFAISAQQSSAPSVRAHLFQLLDSKMKSYEAFDQRNPGFAGFLPWFHVNSSTIDIQWDWKDKVPSLDNGEWIWGLYAVANVLTDLSDPEAKPLAERYIQRLQQLAANAVMVFHWDGNIAAEAHIKNTSATPTRDNYSNNVPGYYLDDPYEGELFVVFADLFGKWDNESDKEQIWTNKQHKYVSVNFTTPEGVITAQQGFWFSAHEQWKILELPYLQTAARDLFVNCERARTWNSFMKLIPGLRASVSGVPGSCMNEGYVSAIGIPELASQICTCFDIVTPYGATPLLAIPEYRNYGLVWYATMINGSRCQGPYGSTEASNTAGTNISPVLTWDSKINSLVGMLGGIGPMNAEFLARDGKLERFEFVIERAYRTAFPVVEGVNIAPQLPSFSLPYMGTFAN